jgi:uncharacterized protein (DUF2164 family)
MFLNLPMHEKVQIIKSIQKYIYEQQGIEIGEIAARNHFDFIMDEIAPYIYNEAIKDAKSVIEDKMSGLEEDMASLERPIR